jgi:VanZ family protein
MKKISHILCKNQLFDILLKCIAPVVAIAIWMLSAQSTLPEIKGVLGWDKMQHLLAYAVLAIGVVCWFPDARWNMRTLQLFFLTAGITSLYGVTDEVHQYFVEGRYSSIYDWIADTIGAFIGAWLCISVRKKRMMNK